MVPLYLQLKQHLIHLISYGTWQPNMPVPSVRQLVTDLRMATATVQRVYQELQAEGLLTGRPGRGVFVTDLAGSVPPRTEERSEILRALLARLVRLLTPTAPAPRLSRPPERRSLRQRPGGAPAPKHPGLPVAGSGADSLTSCTSDCACWKAGMLQLSC